MVENAFIFALGGTSALEQMSSKIVNLKVKLLLRLLYFASLIYIFAKFDNFLP